MTEPAPAVVFRGDRDTGSAAAVAVVVVEDERTGELVGVLEHRVRYSPTGLNWGYDGAGPRDLARSLLAAALGEAACCPACRGAGGGSCCVDGLRPDLPEVAFTREVVARLPAARRLPAREIAGWWDDQDQPVGGGGA